MGFDIIEINLVLLIIANDVVVVLLADADHIYHIYLFVVNTCLFEAPEGGH